MISLNTASVPFDKLKYFLKNGLEERLPSKADIHVLNGWRPSTLMSYNSAVAKFNRFLTSEGIVSLVLPVTASLLEEFVSGQAETTATFPDDNNPRLALLLKASAKKDESSVTAKMKLPVMLWHMAHLWKSLVLGDELDRAVLDVSIVAFWGLARLAELTYIKDGNSINFGTSVLTTDVSFTESVNLGAVVTLTVRNAKTAKPGSPQIITLCEQHHELCPVLAVKRRLASSAGETTSLFGYKNGPDRIHLTRYQVASRVEEVLTNGGFPGIKGHSFRVGGASIRSALGMSQSDLCALGRWKSDCFKLYIRKYSDSDLKRTRLLLHHGPPYHLCPRLWALCSSITP
ncbi:uncharacterized protein PGTG_06584 [Puccinia graminis f. sp. tritici CRL 75-36-700-3]|uniref:Tyr recombinase domain-containing protein n=1 Tax=Puccinia graminis f. sp. tritici (strain CRL 75-36-700-3 / race SCCL) TaxID=418459 RepID=E3K8P7_PUCGT|nr:uncharacterized protein PGTG_06584 [Puccinia graminis f. sp. tritici CRL 75-36-700-3]EFP80628.2 hypothetical protein PGTG_06584 [Puccinia graminis f. sp. tritici CRL 75-36-700-3]